MEFDFDEYNGVFDKIKWSKWTKRSSKNTQWESTIF